MKEKQKKVYRLEIYSFLAAASDVRKQQVRIILIGIKVK